MTRAQRFNLIRWVWSFVGGTVLLVYGSLWLALFLVLWVGVQQFIDMSEWRQ